MSGICDTCQRNQVCRRPMDGMDSCRLYVSGRESNYEKLFGTPERAISTLADAAACDRRHCDECRMREMCIAASSRADDSENAMLEWLRGDAE